MSIVSLVKTLNDNFLCWAVLESCLNFSYISLKTKRLNKKLQADDNILAFLKAGLGNVHRRNVLNLYRVILRLHERLPLDLKTLGDLYVKSEFRLHKNCSPDAVPQFMQQWTVYARNLHQQIDDQNIGRPLDVGDDLSLEKIDSLSEDQVLQLIELMRETTKANRQFNIKDD